MPGRSDATAVAAKPPSAPGSRTKSSSRVRVKARKSSSATASQRSSSKTSRVSNPGAGDAQLRRRARNRLSAQLFREKQRKYVKKLEKQLEMATQERDALRICLLGFLDVPCKCKSADVYRSLAARIMNAAHVAAAKRREEDDEAEELQAAAAGRAASPTSGGSSDSEASSSTSSDASAGRVPRHKQRPTSPQASIAAAGAAGAARAVLTNVKEVTTDEVEPEALPIPHRDTVHIGLSLTDDDDGSELNDDTSCADGSSCDATSASAIATPEFEVGVGAGAGAGAGADDEHTDGIRPLSGDDLDLLDAVFADPDILADTYDLPPEIAGEALDVPLPETSTFTNPALGAGEVLLPHPSCKGEFDKLRHVQRTTSSSWGSGLGVGVLPSPGPVATAPAPAMYAPVAPAVTAASSTTVPMGSEPRKRPFFAPNGYTMGHAAPLMDDSPRPHKAARRTMLVLGLVFAFVLAGVPFLHEWDAAGLANNAMASNTIHLGGSRGFAPGGGYWVARDSGGFGANVGSMPTGGMPTSGMPTMSTMSGTMETGGGMGGSRRSAISASPVLGAGRLHGAARVLQAMTPMPERERPEEDADAQSTALVATPQPEQPHTPWDPRTEAPAKALRGAGLSGMVMYQKLRGARMQPTSPVRSGGPANVTLVPASPPTLRVDSGRPGSYIELTGPLQTYANSVYASHLAQRAAKASAAAQEGTTSRTASDDSGDASFVMCPEAVGALSSWADGRETAASDRPTPSGASSQLASSAARASASDAPTAESSYLVLLVPAASLQDPDAEPGSDSAGWVEVGCDVRSVRHVQSIHLSSAEA